MYKENGIKKSLSYLAIPFLLLALALFPKEPKKDTHRKLLDSLQTENSLEKKIVLVKFNLLPAKLHGQFIYMLPLCFMKLIENKKHLSECIEQKKCRLYLLNKDKKTFSMTSLDNVTAYLKNIRKEYCEKYPCETDTENPNLSLFYKLRVHDQFRIGIVFSKKPDKNKKNELEIKEALFILDDKYIINFQSIPLKSFMKALFPHTVT